LNFEVTVLITKGHGLLQQEMDLINDNESSTQMSDNRTVKTVDKFCKNKKANLENNKELKSDILNIFNTM